MTSLDAPTKPIHGESSPSPESRAEPGFRAESSRTRPQFRLGGCKSSLRMFAPGYVTDGKRKRTKKYKTKIVWAKK